MLTSTSPSSIHCASPRGGTQLTSSLQQTICLWITSGGPSFCWPDRVRFTTFVHSQPSGTASHTDHISTIIFCLRTFGAICYHNKMKHRTRTTTKRDRTSCAPHQQRSPCVYPSSAKALCCDL